MAEEQTEGTGAPAPKGPPKGPLILVLVNTVVILATAGFFIYSQVLFKRPQITEEGERQKLSEAHSAPEPETKKGYVQFDPITLNIAPNPGQPKTEEGSAKAVEGKLHYATISFNLEIRDIEKREVIEQVRGIIMDRLLTLMGRKQFHELTTVQGRYLLRSQILDISNELAAKAMGNEGPGGAPLVMEVYFTQFIVQ